MPSEPPPNDPPLSSPTEPGATSAFASGATTTIALIGATPIAQQIAARAIPARLNVIIDDISDARLHALSLNLRSYLEAQHCCAPGPQDQPDSRSPGLPSPLATLLLTQSIESAIRSADFLIDALPDDLEVKLELFTLFDKFAKPGAIFITTGSIPIDDLAEITFCPERCVSVRFSFAPNAVESSFQLASGKQTAPQTLASCVKLFSQMLAYRIT